MSGKRVTFHEDGREYQWNIASHEVVSATGCIIADDCYNLKDAREAVRSRNTIKPISAELKPTNLPRVFIQESIDC